MGFDVGKKLRELREARGFTSQDSFASHAGVSRQRIQQIEKPGAKPRRSTLVFFLSKLGVTEDEFLHPRPVGKNTIRDSEEEPAYKLPSEDRLAGLDARERELIEKLLDLLRTRANPADVKGSITANVNSFWEFLPAREKTVRTGKKGKKAS